MLFSNVLSWHGSHIEVMVLITKITRDSDQFGEAYVVGISETR